jgi:hypothetical protein
MTATHEAAPGQPGRSHGGDGLVGAAILFLFYLLCMGSAAYLYWRGTGKMPWA